MPEAEQDGSAQRPHPARALEGIRVVDLTQVLAGPYCTQILGDFGAEVIKVESPSGDQARASMGPQLVGSDRAGFLAVNRNKRSLTVDLRNEAGLNVFKRLVEGADVLVENFRPGVTRRLGIDYEAMREVNPRLIYASISGFGQTGPQSVRPGYDLIAQAMSGIMSVTGEAGGAPVKCGIPISDLTAGLYATIGILTAVAARTRTGSGQRVETALFDAAVGLSIWEAVDYWATGRAPAPLGSAHRFNAPYQALRAKGGYLTVAANNPRSWRKLCEVLERTDLLEDPRFVNNDARMINLGSLVDELENAMQAASPVEWAAKLIDAGVACGPIRTYPEVLEDEDTRARGLIVSVPHPVEGELSALAIPVSLAGTPASIRRGAPLLSADTDEVLTEIGFQPDEIAELHAANAV